MLRWIRGFVVAALILSLLSGVDSKAWAVFSGGANGGVVKNSQGRPLAGAKVRITLRTSAGTTKTTETDTNDFGAFFIPSNGGGGEVTKVEFEKDGKIYSFFGPFEEVPEAGGLIIPGTSGDDILLDFNLAQANSVRSAPGNGVNVTRSYANGNGDPLFKASLTGAYSFGSANTSVDQNGTRTKGRDLDYSIFSIRPDVRVYLGPLANLGYFGNLGNMGGVGNLAFGPSHCYAGVQGAIGVSGGDKGVKTDQHGSGNEIDTILKGEFQGSILPYLGCRVLTFPNNFGYLNLQGGPRISFWEYVFSTDESQGGFNFERFTMNETHVGAAFGLEYNKHFSYGNLENVGLGHDVRGGLQIGFWGEYLPGTNFRATTGSGFNYLARTKSTVLWTTRFGWGMYF